MKVFLSSTRLDLVDERTVAWLALRLSGHEVFRMEDFESVTNDSWTECAAGLANADLYVLLLGHRYGSELARTGLSYTHAEYEIARRNGVPVLAFVKDDFSNQAARAVDGLRLRDFHDQVSEAHNIHWPYFADLEALADQIEEAVKLHTGRATLRRPRFNAAAPSAPDRYRVAVTLVRALALDRVGFATTVVDGPSVMSRRVPKNSPARLLKEALALVEQFKSSGIDAQMFNDISANGADDAEILLKRASDVQRFTNALIVLVNGRHDYLRASAFRASAERLAAAIPDRVTIAPEHLFATTVIPWTNADLEDGLLARDVAEFVYTRAEAHLLDNY